MREIGHRVPPRQRGRRATSCASRTCAASCRRTITCSFRHCEHVHFYGFYIGNFPDLRDDEIDAICGVVNAV